MKPWWRSLAARERRILVLGGLVVVCSLFYALAWRPLSQGIALNRERATILRADLEWMQAASAKIEALRTGRTKQATPTGGSLAAVVDRSARRMGMEKSIAQLAPDGVDTVTVSLSGADFDAMLRWLAELAGQGIGVQRLSLTPGRAPGQVQATLSLKRGGGR